MPRYFSTKLSFLMKISSTGEHQPSTYCLLPVQGHNVPTEDSSIKVDKPGTNISTRQFNHYLISLIWNRPVTTMALGPLGSLPLCYWLSCLAAYIHWPFSNIESHYGQGLFNFQFSDALASLALMVVTGWLTDSLTDQNWRLAILHVWQLFHHPSSPV